MADSTLNDTNSRPPTESDIDVSSDMALDEIPSENEPTGGTKRRADAIRHSQLHIEVEKFAKMLEMDVEEGRRKRELVQIVTDASWKLFRKQYPALKVRPFGGYVNGLSARLSDVDIVLTGMFSPDGIQGGYTESTKRVVTKSLELLQNNLSIPVKRQQLIRHARIPVLKLKTEDGIDLDISIGDHGGPEAATFIKSQIEEFPVARPLVLVVKYMLKSRQLNDVSTSGLGTYSVANMAIAYIKHLRNLKESINEYGNVLLGFLNFYGSKFDLRRQAISLKSGTFCRKSEAVIPGENPTRYRICIQDYFTGNDISGGTCKVDEIVLLFQETYRSLSRYKKTGEMRDQRSMFPLLANYVNVPAPSTPIVISDTDDEITYKEWNPGKRARSSSGRDSKTSRDRGRRDERERRTSLKRSPRSGRREEATPSIRRPSPRESQSRWESVSLDYKSRRLSSSIDTSRQPSAADVQSTPYPPMPHNDRHRSTFDPSISRIFATVFVKTTADGGTTK